MMNVVYYETNDVIIKTSGAFLFFKMFDRFYLIIFIPPQANTESHNFTEELPSMPCNK